MAEPLVIRNVDDTYVDSTRPTGNFRGMPRCQVKAGTRRTMIRWSLGDVDSADVTSKVLTAHVGPGWLAQTVTFAPLLSTYTPGKVTWRDGQPDVGPGVAFPVPAKPDGGALTFDLTGLNAPHGFRVTSNTTAEQQYFNSSESGKPSWEVVVSYVEDVDDPSNLRPSGGGAVTPGALWAWDFGDQAEFKLDVFADDDATVPTWSSGWVVSPESVADPVALGFTPT